MISLSQLCFVITYLTFLTTTCTETFPAIFETKIEPPSDIAIHKKQFGDLHNAWTYGVFFLIILTGLAWVRNIAVFSFTFILGNLLIMLTVLVIAIVSFNKILNEGTASNLIWINSEHTGSIWSSVGYCIYAFEGVGVLMPIMQASEKPEKFEYHFKVALVIITGLIMGCGIANYVAYGSKVGMLATQTLPQESAMTKVMLLMYSLNVIFTFPLTLFPTNIIFESWTVDKWFPRKSSKENYYFKNLQRAFLCVFIAAAGISFAAYLDIIMSLIGSLFCAPLALIIPTLTHLAYIAKTRNEKLEDIGIIIVSLIVMLVCVIQTISSL